MAVVSSGVGSGASIGAACLGGSWAGSFQMGSKTSSGAWMQQLMVVSFSDSFWEQDLPWESLEKGSGEVLGSPPGSPRKVWQGLVKDPPLLPSWVVS